MKASTIFATLAAFASSVQAVKFTNSAITPVAGQSFTLTWDDAVGPVSIYVVTGTTTVDLTNYATVGSGLSGGSYTFTLSANDYASGVYAFKIEDTEGFNYSERFSLLGSKQATSSNANSSASSASASSTIITSTVSSANATTTSSSKGSSSSTAKSTSSRISSSSSASASSTDVPGEAGRMASPLALILVSAAAMVFLN